MNEPNIPDDSRDWNSIDIFLFSNGQEYSPPRKYHLQADDLRWWDNTKSFLARSQYGSLHSAIDIHTLDGKKIEGPLELKNAAAYVAVVPPDAFIPAGYEKYLFKASRSWEKRQGKLLNSNEMDDTGETNMRLDITTIEQIEEIVSLRIDENSISDAEDKSHNQKAVDRSSIPKSISAKFNKSYPKKNSSDSERTFMKNRNISNTKVNKNDNCLTKKKINPFKSQKWNNKQQIPSKNTRCPKLITRVNSNDSKTNPNQTRTSYLPKIDNKKYGPKINSGVTHMKDNNKTSLEKELILKPGTNNNAQNDMDSIQLVIDETLTGNNTKNQLETCKKYENVSEDGIKKHSLSTDNSKGKLNIQLKIKLEDFANPSENGSFVKNNGSYVTLIKKEMASQVNIDVILGKEIFTLNNNLFMKRKSIESYTTKTEAQDLFVQCTCDNLIQKLGDLNGSWPKNVSKLSNATDDVLVESCCQCNKDKIEMIDKGIQKSISSCSNVALSSTKAINRESINVAKYTIPTLNEDSTENRTKQQYEEHYDTIATVTEVPFCIPKLFEDKSVQTEWCDVLLQAKCHEDGRYSFHLPPLSLLKQYNIEQM